MAEPKKRLCALVVDDDPNVCTMAGRVLEKAGYEVERAATGEAALRVLEGRTVDVAFVDRNLPGIRGAEVIKRARVLQPEIAIVMMSADSEVTDQTRSAAGPFLQKPFKSLKDLVRAAEAALAVMGR